ncbi:hypothetical protein DJ64_09005 [Streptomyces griseorubens]|uniref:Uncharacterized protein n=1 Tax=Streptomyces griseorubens TaxID=66897 RepID=A0ABR4SZ24_9ACTN|nr:hypothetical protein DJ64_09005 [Streptomyces griseorubens]
MTGPTTAIRACRARSAASAVAGPRGGEVDRAELAQGPAGAAEFVEHLEVVQKGQFGVDGEGEHLPAPGSDGDLPLLVRQRLRLEELRDALPALDLDEKRPLPLLGQGQRQSGGHRGLAGSALATHDLEPAHAFEPKCSPRVAAAPGDVPASVCRPGRGDGDAGGGRGSG